MPIDNKDITWVEEPIIGFWEATYLPAILTGLKTTLRHVTHFNPTTEQFPEEKPTLPLHYRGVHRLNRDDQGNVKCVACMMCATACPANCITIEGAQAPWEYRDKYPASFVIDELRCIYCGMCEEACPVDAIEMTHLYDLTGFSRQEMIFDKEKLLGVFDQTKDSGHDPVRTQRGKLGPASDFAGLPSLSPATTVKADDRSARSVSSGVIQGTAEMKSSWDDINNKIEKK